MTTFMANKQTIERKWYVLDAAGVSLGHTAAKAAALLRGKLEQKMYRTHSGYVGGLKETKYRILMAQKPELAMKLAVKGMLPRNSVGRWSLGRLKVYAGPVHKHEAQKPVLCENN